MTPIKLGQAKRPAGLALILLAAMAAGCLPRPTPTSTPILIVVTATAPAGTDVTPVNTGTATPAPTTSTVEVTALPPTTAPAGQGVLFGPFHLPETEFKAPYTGAFRGLKTDNAAAILDAARAAGFRLVIQLAGSRPNYQAAGGAFSLEGYQAQLEAFKDFDFAPYVADGTIMGHMMFDEPFDPGNWNGKPVPFADIEAAAAYSKQFWPTMPVGVGAPATFLDDGAPWSALDFAFSQYISKFGEVKTWTRNEVEAARQADLGLLLSINILGGNSRNNVTAEQLKTWGMTLISEPVVCGLLMWKYDPGYLQDANITASLAEIGQAARQRTSPACQPEGQ